MSLPVQWDKIWSWNVSQTLVKFLTKMGRAKKNGIFSGISGCSPPMWACEPQGRGIRLQLLPMANSEETQNTELQVPDSWGTCQWNKFNGKALTLASPYTEKSTKFLKLKCCLLDSKFSISKSTGKVDIFPRGKKKSQVWNTDTDGRHSQKDPSDATVRRVTAPLPTILWSGNWQWGIVTGKSLFWLFRARSVSLTLTLVFLPLLLL